MKSGIVYNAPRKGINFNTLDYYLENDKTLTYLEADELYAQNTDEPITYSEMIDNFNTELYLIPLGNSSATTLTTNGSANKFYILPFNNLTTTYINENTTIIGNDMVTPSATSALFKGDLVGNATTSVTSNFSNTITDATQPNITQMQNINTITNVTLTSDTLNTQDFDFWHSISTLNCNKLKFPYGVAVKDDVQFCDSTTPFSLDCGAGKSFKSFLRPFSPYSGIQALPSMECKYEYNGTTKEQSVCDLRHSVATYHGLTNRENYRQATRWDFLYKRTGPEFELYASTASIVKRIMQMHVPGAASDPINLHPELLLGEGFSTQVELRLAAGISFSVEGIKSFTIDHPLKNDYSIRHSCIESPRFDNIYRDEIKLVDGYVEINIDKHFNLIQMIMVN